MCWSVIKTEVFLLWCFPDLIKTSVEEILLVGEEAGNGEDKSLPLVGKTSPVDYTFFKIYMFITLW